MTLAGRAGPGVAGLLLVVPIAALLALGAGGAEGSVLVLGPLVTFALPLVAMVAFWWNDWPGTRLRPSWAGWADTALIAAGAVVLTAVGQALAGGVDPRGLFDASPGTGHVPTFPATLPLAAAAFVAMLQLTFVGEGWPLHRLPWLPAGLAAVAVAWGVALVVFFVLARIPAPPGTGVTRRDGPVAGADLGAALVSIGAWQVLISVVWHGWPFALIPGRALRLGCAHAAVLAAGIATFLVVHDAAGVPSARFTAAAGCFVAAGLLVGLLFEGRVTGRVVALLAVLAVAVVLLAGLDAVAAGLPFTRVDADAWVAHASLNAIGFSTILHVAIGRRWPFDDREHRRGALGDNARMRRRDQLEGS